MRRVDYEEARKSNPDWDKEVAQDIKAWSKLYIFDAVLSKREYKAIIEAVGKRIDAFTSLIEQKEIRDGRRAELYEYANALYKWATEHFGRFTPYLLGLALTKNPKPAEIKILQKNTAAVMVDFGDTPLPRISIPAQRGEGYTTAVGGNMYYREMQKLVRSQLNEYAKSDPKPRYYANVNPRNIAEMSVRFEAYKSKKQSLIDKGVRFVYVPPHSNCSKRCQPLQGKVYSLDGTSGTIDGRRFIPIEDAAENITYKSERTGRTYYNGLFSYNCRHTLDAYERGMNIERIPDGVIEKTREAEMQQREMERHYRSLREKEELYRIVYKHSGNEEIHKEATAIRAEAAELRKKYVAFSKKSGLAYLPNRLQIMEGENRYVRTYGKGDTIAKQALKLKQQGESLR